MKPSNLPVIDSGYWVAIVAASMCGANSGDLAAGPLGLGHVKGLLPMALIFFAIVLAEKTLKLTTIAFYWLAIIVLRTMATNLADFATHDMKLEYPVFQAMLIVFMGAMIWLDRGSDKEASGVIGKDGIWRSLPSTNWNYWITMLAAGTLGTAFGDWIAEKDELNFGVYWGSALCAPIFLVALWAAYKFGKLAKPWYWIAIVACRTFGTDLGDMLVTLLRMVTPTRPLGLWASTGLTALALTAIIVFWKHKNADQLKETEPTLEVV